MHRQFFQKIDLPDGTSTNGLTDHRADPALLGIDQRYMTDKRVLDIGANDGFWVFWAERNGSRDTLAIDVESYDRYDWGFAGPPPQRGVAPPKKDDNFSYLKSIYGFKTAREHIAVYDLDPARHGLFDVVFFYGVLYHLRHPLLAFDRIRRVSAGVVFVETHLHSINHLLPSSVFYRDDVFGITNWTGPSEACVVEWMRDGGFPMVFRERKHKGPLRARFIGCVDASCAAHFETNTNFVLCDNAYYAAVKAETLRSINEARHLSR